MIWTWPIVPEALSSRAVTEGRLAAQALRLNPLH